MRIIVRVLINAVALWAAARLVDGIELSSEIGTILLVAAVFGLVNALLRPIAKLLTLPLTVLSLGLFILVVNAAMLQVTDFLTSGLTVTGFWASVFGGLVISIVSWMLSIFLPDDNKQDDRSNEDS